MNRTFYFLILVTFIGRPVNSNSGDMPLTEKSGYLPASVSNRSFEDSIPDKRAHHELIYNESTGKILMTAGSTPLDGGNSFSFFNDLWQFDGKDWKRTGNAGTLRSGIRMAFDTKRKKLYSYGGYADNQSLSDFRVM